MAVTRATSAITPATPTATEVRSMNNPGPFCVIAAVLVGAACVSTTGEVERLGDKVTCPSDADGVFDRYAVVEKAVTVRSRDAVDDGRGARQTAWNLTWGSRMGGSVPLLS